MSGFYKKYKIIKGLRNAEKNSKEIKETINDGYISKILALNQSKQKM